jgi:hypothetical protein
MLNIEKGIDETAIRYRTDDGAVELKMPHRSHRHEAQPLGVPRARQDSEALMRAARSASVPLKVYMVAKMDVNRGWTPKYKSCGGRLTVVGGSSASAPYRRTSAATIACAKASSTPSAVVKSVKSYCE